MQQNEFISLAMKTNASTLYDLVERRHFDKIKHGFSDAVTALNELYSNRKILYLGVSWDGVAISKSADHSVCLVDWSNSVPYKELDRAPVFFPNDYYKFGSRLKDYTCLDLVALLWLFADVVLKLSGWERLAS